MRNSNEQHILRQKYIEMHLSIERLMLDQGKGYAEVGNLLMATTPSIPLRFIHPNNNTSHNIVSIRNRWVGKSGRIRREGMDKRVNFCRCGCLFFLFVCFLMQPHRTVHEVW